MDTSGALAGRPRLPDPHSDRLQCPSPELSSGIEASSLAGAAASLRDAGDAHRHRLGVRGALKATLSSTDPCESMIESPRDRLPRPSVCRSPSPLTILRCASTSRRSSSGAGRAFRPSRPAPRNSSRYPAIRPADWPALSRERVEALAPEQAQDQLLLCAALQRTFRPPQTLDIIDLQGSYRVSGQNRVRTIANCSGLVVCASRRSPATLALPGHPGAVMCVLARLPQLSLNGALVVWPSAYVLDDRGSLRARRAVPPRK